jgi:signal transduction histidine kinase/CheY-like chemotaxis protein
MRLRSHFALLTFGTLLPVAIAGTITAWLFVEHDRDAFRRATLERTLALSTAVDAEIDGSIATARALGESLDVNVADFAAFRGLAQRILATQPHWSNINLALPDGQQLVNLARPPGAPLHSIAGVDESVERIQRDRKPVVNDIAYGTATQAWDVAIRVPVIRDGEIRYILSGIVRPESISQLLVAQRLPPDWVALVVDRKGNIVGRSREGQGTAGQPAMQKLRDAIGAAPTGWFRGITPDGDEVYTAYQRSALTGWTVAIRVPVDMVDGIAARAAWVGALTLLGALGVAVALAVVIGRRIERPIESLAEAAVAIGRGEHPALPSRSPVNELAALSSALQAASSAIADRQRLLERERETLKAMDRSKNEFIAMLSHELRNPLAPIVIGADLLQKNAAPARIEATAAMIKRQARQITRLIEDLLDISGIVMGKVRLERTRLDMAEVAREVAETWRSAGRFARHRLELALKPAWVDADRSRMEQVVSNLLANSVKFTPADGTVRIATRVRGKTAVLEVSDTGKGLTSELIAVAFDPFVQGKQNLERSAGGLGIGLALVKQLALLHGGTAAIESEGPGRGAKVTVSLPRAAAAAARSQRGEEAALSSRTLRILVVEDNDDTRRTLRDALQAEGHELHEAADGRAAIEAAGKLHPDVALVDIGLPQADGYAVARELRRRFDGEIVLVALTGYGQRDDRERALSEGFDEHMVKPVTRERLARVIAQTAARLH